MNEPQPQHDSPRPRRPAAPRLWVPLPTNKDRIPIAGGSIAGVLIAIVLWLLWLLGNGCRASWKVDGGSTGHLDDQPNWPTTQR